VKVRRDSSGNETQYYPDVLYEYFVDGKSVWGWKLSHEEEPQPRAYWEDRLRGYKEGDTVSAYVHRVDPKDAVLDPRHDGDLHRLVLKIAVGAGFFLAGMALFAIPVQELGRKLFRRSDQ
jgi:hypothetical protein